MESMKVKTQNHSLSSNQWMCENSDLNFERLILLYILSEHVPNF